MIMARIIGNEPFGDVVMKMMLKIEVMVVIEGIKSDSNDDDKNK